MRGFFSSWTDSICLFIVLFSSKLSRNFFLSWTVAVCLSLFCLEEKLTSQFLHLNVFFPQQLLQCVYGTFGITTNSQTSHLNDFSFMEKNWWLLEFVDHIFFRNKTFLFFKIEAETFRFSLKFKFVKPHKISIHLAFLENCYFQLFYWLSDWVEILWGFTKFNFKLNLKVSAF